MSLSSEEARRRQHRFITGFVRWLGSASPGAQVFERPALVAAIVPAAAQRSIVNSVVAADAAALAGPYEELADAYRAAGVVAWTVWIDEEDTESRTVLEERGHAFDGAPVAMTLDLGNWDAGQTGELDWDAQASFDELGRLNDHAYGYERETGIARALGAPCEDLQISLYRARVDGEVASVLGILDIEDDAGVLFVATPPQHRGRGLASRLLTAALHDARARGMRSSSLQASALGSPIYERLGYEARFRFHIMERRFDPGG